MSQKSDGATPTVTTFEYDALGRLIRSVDSNGDTTTFSWDGARAPVASRKRKRRIHGQAMTAVISILIAAWLACAAAPAFSTAPTGLERALRGVVRIGITFHWPGVQDTLDVAGSGWTRQCTWTPSGWCVAIATAGHVVDVEDIERIYHAGQRATIRVIVTYRDGRQFLAGRGDLRLDRIRDYGEVRFLSSTARPVLPTGEPGDVSLGDPLYTVASPGNIAFGVFTGHLILRAPIPARGAPANAWIASIQIGPGASGGPVMDAQGRVVATVIGTVTWRWGATSSVIVPIPGSLLTLPTKRGLAA